MHFNFACITACVFAAAAIAVPVEVERKVVVVRADVCPAPAPATTASSPPAEKYTPPPPAPAPASPVTTTVSNPPPAQQSTSVDNKQCSAGTSVHCCDTVDSTDNSNVLNALNAAGLDHGDATQKGQVGLTCKFSSIIRLKNEADQLQALPSPPLSLTLSTAMFARVQSLPAARTPTRYAIVSFSSHFRS